VFFERLYAFLDSLPSHFGGESLIPGEMVYLGKGEGAICCRLYSLRERYFCKCYMGTILRDLNAQTITVQGFSLGAVHRKGRNFRLKGREG
jgi:hypothetical protein